MPIPGDQRAWDATVRGVDWVYGVEAETAPHDGQSLTRRLQLKQRDSGVDGILLAVRDTRTVRQFLDDAEAVLRPLFATTSREALSMLRAGKRPIGNSVVIVPRAVRRRPR